MVPVHASEPLYQSQPMPLVGRLPEQQALASALRAVLEGRGGIALVGGEAGIGKTTLIEWALERARLAGFDTFLGHCYDMAVTPPFGPWRDAAAGAGAGVAGWLRLLGSPGLIESAPALLDAVRDDLLDAARSRPVVVALDDLHWTDASSVELLRLVARDAGSAPLLLLAAYRADDVDRCPALARALPLLVRESRATRLDLRPLSLDDARALARDVYGLKSPEQERLATRLLDGSGGNPLYLTELLRSFEHDRVIRRDGDEWVVGDLADMQTPPMARRLVSQRLERLDPAARDLLGLAAIVGQTAPLDVLQPASGLGDEIFTMLDTAARAGIVAVTPDLSSIRYSHALVRDAVRESLTLPRQRALLRAVARVLAARPDPPLSEIASHLARAGDPEAIDWMIRAGEQAQALFAPHDAISAFDHAHDLAARFSQALPLAVYRARATALATVGEFERARRDHEHALDRARVAGDTWAEWQALLDLALLWSERDYDRSGVFCRAALDLARRIDDPPLIARSLNRLGNWHVNRDELPEAMRYHRQALGLFEDATDVAGVAETLDLIGMTSYLSADIATCARHYERALPLFRESEDRHQVALCLAVLSLCGGELDGGAMPVFREHAFWSACAEESLAVAREIGWQAGEALGCFVVSNVAGTRGDLGSALRHAAEGLGIARRIRHREWEVACLHALGVTRRELLDAESARAALEQALAIARSSGTQVWVYTAAAALAETLVDLGNARQALALLDPLVSPQAEPRSMGRRLCRHALATAALADGDPDRALALLGTLDDDRGSVPRFDLTRGFALARLGRHAEAETALMSARDAAALFGFRPLLWRAEAALARLCCDSGQPATAHSRAALVTIEWIAATLDDEAQRRAFLAKASALASGERDRSGTAPLVRLSAREMEVLRLLVDGSTDRNIAESLRISPRTVHRHVTSIFNKLGVNTRTAAASVALRNGIV